jgi:peptidoglycan L-alanyl-D-glutamate endopeptidase CwlK
MYVYSAASLERLASCDPCLIAVFKAVIGFRDARVLVGHRGKIEQNRAYADGFSQKRWPDGEHNGYPSRAVDASPYPVPDMEDRRNHPRFYYFGGIVMGIAYMLGVKLRYGGDWDGDGNTRNQSFFDLVHFEVEEHNAKYHT